MMRRRFSNRSMAREVYDQTFALAKRCVKVMKVKKRFIFESHSALNKEDLERGWDRLVKLRILTSISSRQPKTVHPCW